MTSKLKKNGYIVYKILTKRNINVFGRYLKMFKSLMERVLLVTFNTYIYANTIAMCVKAKTLLPHKHEDQIKKKLI